MVVVRSAAVNTQSLHFYVIVLATRASTQQLIVDTGSGFILNTFQKGFLVVGFCSRQYSLWWDTYCTGNCLEKCVN